MKDDDEPKVIVLDKVGNILCLSEDGKNLISCPLEEVTLDRIFMFWEKDLNHLKEFINNILEYSNGIEVLVDLESCSFLDLYIIDKDKGMFLLG